MERCEITRKLLLEQYRKYPKMQIADIFKYLFQSVFGCGHMVADERAAEDYIKRELAACGSEYDEAEELDGGYFRAPIALVKKGMSEKTLARIFYLSAEKAHGGRDELEAKLSVAKALVSEGELPFCAEEFERELGKWRAAGYPAMHHSEAYREHYRPAYRVIASEYAEFLPLFLKIDKMLANSGGIIAIDGGSASGKTTLAAMIERVYSCAVFHMDDFFLRPEQRTEARLDEAGGNVDRERFLAEVLLPLSAHTPVCYRRFDCSTGALLPEISAEPKALTVVEGAYSMHPELAEYYDLSVFLDIGAEYQKERILKRNSEKLAKRFFEEWIPLENIYFSKMCVKERCDISFSICKREAQI